MASRKAYRKHEPKRQATSLKRKQLPLTLICSLGLHSVIPALPWQISSPAPIPEPPLPPLHMVELLPLAEPMPLPSADRTLYNLQAFHHTAVERAEKVERSLLGLAGSLAC